MNNQITPMTCALASFEAILDDFGMPMTQCEMLIKFKRELSYGIDFSKDAHIFGSAHKFNLPLICARLNLKFTVYDDLDKNAISSRWDNLGNTKGVMAGITNLKGQHHMMKLVELKGEDASFLEPCFYKDQVTPINYTLDELISYKLEDWIIEK